MEPVSSIRARAENGEARCRMAWAVKRGKTVRFRVAGGATQRQFVMVRQACLSRYGPGRCATSPKCFVTHSPNGLYRGGVPLYRVETSRERLRGELQKIHFSATPFLSGE